MILIAKITNIGYFLIILLITGCYPKSAGTLYVSAPSNGTFEIFQISQKEQRLTSSTKGQFNRPLRLTANQYLILGDCSSRIVNITPQQTISIAATTIQFIPPTPPKKKDKFSIQCVRNQKYNYHQSLYNKYKLTVLSDNHELLINMYKLKINTKNKINNKIKIKLGIIQVSAKTKYSHTHYYTTPLNNPTSITLSQKINNSLFLIPGIYKVILNGTEKTIELDRVKIIKASYFRVKRNKFINKQPYTLKTNPHPIIINNKVPLSLNETYPLLPGQITFKFKNSFYKETIDLASNQSSTLYTQSLIVDTGCSPWEWECLNHKKIFISHARNKRRFQQGSTETVLNYRPKKTLLSIETSRGLFFKIPETSSHKKIRTGTLTLIPKPKHQPGLTTDLVQLTSNEKIITGKSKDIPFTHKTTIYLIEGEYVLSQYISNTDLNVTNNKRYLRIKHHEPLEVHFNYYTSNKTFRKKIKEYRKEQEKLKNIHNQIQSIKKIIH